MPPTRKSWMSLKHGDKYKARYAGLKYRGLYCASYVGHAGQSSGMENKKHQVPALHAFGVESFLGCRVLGVGYALNEMAQGSGPGDMGFG